MVEDGREEAEYYLANKGRIDSLCQDLELMLERDPDTIVINIVRDESGENEIDVIFDRRQLDAFLANKYDAALDPIASQAAIDEMTEYVAITLGEIAANQAELILNLARLEYLAQHNLEAEIPGMECTFQDGNVKILAKLDNAGRKVTFITTSFNGITLLGASSILYIHIDDNMIAEKFVVNKIGTATPYVTQDVEPSDDELVSSANTIIGGEDYKFLKYFMVGAFTEEADLDQALQFIRMRHMVIVPTDILERLLAELKTYALNAKANRELAETGSSRPSMEKLHEMKELIEQLL